MNPYAYFDYLALLHLLGRGERFLGIGEVHLFGYLSCLLSIYRGKPASAWGYTFACTEEGSPFSHELQSAKITAVNLGYCVQRNDHFVNITDRGSREFLQISDLSVNADRMIYHRGACSSLLAIPAGQIRSAISGDMTIQNAHELHTARPLLNESTADELYKSFRILKETIGVIGEDLMIPATVWIRYLSSLDEAS
jgi:hypothetical protein